MGAKWVSVDFKESGEGTGGAARGGPGPAEWCTMVHRFGVSGARSVVDVWRMNLMICSLRMVENCLVV